MDERVSKSLSRLENLPHYGFFTKSVRVGKGVVFVLGSKSTRRKFSIGEGGREDTKGCVLCKQSAEGSRRTISINREVGFCINNGFQETEALLPSSCYQCHNRLSAQESNEQVGSCKMTNPMGCRA